MDPIVLAILLVGGLGLLAGLILAIASVLMAVPVDKRVEDLREMLPGANCGACGYSGCDGYAEAMASGEAAVGLCSPGGQAVATATGDYLGVSGQLVAKTALVRCGGCEGNTKRKLEYHGLQSCAAAAQFYGGDWQCQYGCLGYGDCVAVCEYGAIKIENGLAKVDPTLCRGCSKCKYACPKHLIFIRDLKGHGVVRCRNHDKGAVTRKTCTVGCIGCGKCTRVCEYGAVYLDNNVAYIDTDKCVGCGKCAESCPTKCISIF